MPDKSLPVAPEQLKDETFVAAIYDELRRMANWYLQKEDSNISVSAHSLVHEAYVRLTNHRNMWQDRRRFFSHAAYVMQRILVDRARAKRAEKRGKNSVRVQVDLQSLTSQTESTSFDVILLDDAIESLAEHSPESAELARLSLFAGLSIEEASQVIGISRPTAYRYWGFARTWLFKHLAEADQNSAET